ncbi:hypothetical protein BGZ88_004678 [Linnemannia elongata]|uniref:DUF1295-domain-containing protein n=1 Tax=Linnemannia elongata AG-77 TaxID=1314771 RepID=A0A197JYL7_9FUNG|nr:hypothetical protein BGZ88_004678 [Linnemannia elongata]KAG0061150.1 hypothetical protein BGZ89_011703 [Linnemannia elongata]OAQ30437.1 DUF1295-domain-containing protein [Linnemannia elongata AG-77]
MDPSYFTQVGKVLVPTLLTDFGVQIAGWSISAFLQTEKFYDLAGSTSFVLCTFISLYKPWDENSIWADGMSPNALLRAIHPRQIIASGTTVVWAAYLGSFLFSRVLNHGDKRFDKVKKVPGRFLIYWLVQGIWVALTALPVYMTNSIPASVHPDLGLQDYIGIALWGLGFAFQVIANYQKQKWRKEIGRDYKRSFISTGLWSLSRHPNYFGECLLWFGSYLVCSSAFSAALESPAPIMSHWMSRLAVFSPMFVTFLITRVSGIPLLERENDRRLKDVVAYWKYKKATSMFVPTLPRRNVE